MTSAPAARSASRAMLPLMASRSILASAKEDMSASLTRNRTFTVVTCGPCGGAGSPEPRRGRSPAPGEEPVGALRQQQAEQSHRQVRELSGGGRAQDRAEGGAGGQAGDGAGGVGSAGPAAVGGDGGGRHACGGRRGQGRGGGEAEPSGEVVRRRGECRTVGPAPRRPRCGASRARGVLPAAA